MNPVAKNLYPGVNAHLNSFLQVEEGAWRSFHAEHIVDLRRTLQGSLPAGYVAVSEQSLQITAIADDESRRERRRTTPDVAIFLSRGWQQPTAGEGVRLSVPTMTLDLAESLDELTDEDLLSGILIYQLGEGGALGRPVTRFELLSPANKPGGSGYVQYEAKKRETLRSGLRLVEIDYLHHSAPVLPTLPRYHRGEAGAFPYTVAIHDPRPSFDQGKVYVYGIAVDAPIPSLPVPLAGADQVQVDFAAAYAATFDSSPFVAFAVDYSREPLALDRFVPEDRARIQAILVGIRQGGAAP
ncbi:MAG: DUF4058 family protein [Anaerolineae bacterium]|nr:DUF4058 family protein [Anaerolineae bacterium]